MRIFWLHLRTSPVRWALPVLLLLDLAILFLRDDHWVGVWPEAGAAAQVPPYVLGALSAPAAAWAASAPVRNGLTEQIAAARVRASTVGAHSLGATAFLLSLPYLVGQAVAFAMTVPEGAPGISLWLGYVGLGEFTVLLSVALGWFLGKAFTPLFAALVAAVGWIFLTMLNNLAVGNIVLRGRSELMVDPLGLSARLAAVAALLVALVWLPMKASALWRISQLWPPALALVMVGLSLSLTDVLASRNPPSAGPACVDGDIRLCVWPEQKKYLPEMREVSRRVNALPQVFQRPAEMEAIGLQQRQQIGDDVVVSESEVLSFEIIEGSRWSYSGAVSSAVHSATFGFTGSTRCRWDVRSSADDRRLLVMGAWLETYLAGNGLPDYRTDAPRDVQEAWAEGRAIANEKARDEQFTWAEREVVDLRGRYCQ